MTSALLSLLLLPAAAQLPTPIPTQSRQAPIQRFGTYHVASGTWTRASSSSWLGSPVVYNNTGPAAYHLQFEDEALTNFQVTDNGRIPSPDDGGQGCDYTIDELDFAYCSAAGPVGGLSVRFDFRDTHAPCTLPAAPIVGSVAATGLPTSATLGTQACWLVAIDLTGTTGVFSLSGDADGVYDADNALDDFGYTVAFTGHGSDLSTGLVVFGDPAGSPFGDGTSNFGYGPGPDGTGLGQEDMFWVSSTTIGSRCAFLGGYPQNPWAGFYLRLHGEAALPGPFGTCGGPPVGAYCWPGSANSVSPNGGILTSTGGFGTSTATFDIVDVPNHPGILYSGANQIMIPFGCGERCAGGNNTRGSVIIPTGNQALGVTFDMSVSTNMNVQYWYRDAANFPICGAPFNLTNAVGF